MILELPKSQTITLKEELNLIRYYISLEEKRFDNNFNFSINKSHPELVNELLIPPLLLQPFVENAIWHGLLPSPHKQKEIQIDIIKKTSTVEISIEDNGVGRTNNKKINSTNKKKSLGTKITRDRIEQFNRSYDCQIHLNITDKNKTTHSEKGRGTRVILTVSDLPDKISSIK